MKSKTFTFIIFLLLFTTFLSNAEATPYSVGESAYDSQLNWWNEAPCPSLDYAVINEIYPVQLEENDNFYTLSGINFESTSTDNTWSYTENGETIDFTYEKMQWDNSDFITSTSSQSVPETSHSSITYPDAITDGISIKIIQDNYQWQKIVEIESLESLGPIPVGAEYLEISFLITGDITLPDGHITKPIPIAANSFIQPVRAWDDNNVDIRGVVGTVSDNIITKRIPVSQLLTVSYPIQTDITITYGSEAPFNSASTTQVSASAFNDTHFVVAYQDTANSSHGTAIIGSVSGSSITYGSESVFNAGSTSAISVVTLDSTHFVVAYADTANTSRGTAIVGVISGTTITSYGSENVFNDEVTSDTSLTTLDSTHFVVGYRYASGDINGCAKVGLVSGTTISSYGAENQFVAGSINYITLSALNSTHFVVVYEDINGYGIVGTVSGTTITSYGTAVDFGSFATHIVCAALDNTRFAIIYVQAFEGKGYAKIGSVSGTTITYGSTIEFNDNYALDESMSTLDSTHFVISYSDNGNSDYGTAMVGTVSGTTISEFSSKSVFNSGTTGFTSVVSLNSTIFVVSYEDESNSNYGTSIVGNAEEPATYIPPTPVSLANTTGNFWVNHTWSAGSGNVTDSFKKSVNGTWYNNTATFYNDTYIAHSWQNITVYAYNSSGTGTLSTNSISQNTQIPNNPVTILNISASYSLNENETFILDANYTDIDNDTATFSDNSSNWTINSTTGEVSWLTTSDDVGIHYYRITVGDGYGSTDYQNFTLTVNDTLEILSTDPTGDFSIYISDAQELSAILNINATATWYVDSVGSQTEYNTTTPDYYFTSSTSGTYNVTVICRDSSTNTSQVNFTWLINVSGVAPTPTPVRANRPVGQAALPVEEIITEEEPGILTSLWDKAEVLDQEDDVCKVIVGLGMLFALLFLFTMKKGGGDAIPGRREPIKR